MNLKGGYKIIDIRKLGTLKQNEQTNITDNDIKEQLMSLAEYVLDDSKELKPIFLRLEMSVMICQLRKLAGANAFEIYGFVNNANLLRIRVGFAIDDETQEIYITNCYYVKSDFTGYIIETIDEAIGEGEIAIGTKLYKHTIAFTTGDEISITTNKNTEYTFTSAGMDILFQDTETFYSYFSSSAYGSGVILNIGYDASDLKVTYFDSDYMEIRTAQISFTTADIENETITEL